MRAPGDTDAIITVDSLPAFERLWMPIWVFDSARARMVWANRAALELWSAASLDEFRARDFTDMSEATRTRLASLLTLLEAGQQPIDQWTFYPKGIPVTVRVRRTGIRLPDGRLAMLHEAHVIDQAIDPAVVRGVEALHHTSVLISLFSIDGRPVMRNPAAIRAYGEPEAGEPLWSLFADPTLPARLRPQLDAKGAVSVEARMRTRNGPRWHGLDARIVTDPISGEAAILVNEQPVETRREAEETLRRTSADLVRSNEELEQFAYVVSHDLRQPLRSVASFLTLLEQHLGETLDDEARECLDFARSGAQRMDSLIVDLLEYSRIGRKVRPMAPVALGEVVEEVLLNLEAALAESKAVVTMAASLPTVHGDRVELVRLLQNLIGNALKYRATNHPPIVRVTSADGGADGGESWRISVADNGIGIAPEHFDRIFGIFQRLHGRDEYEGTGIGLAVCRKIAEHHGGRIWVESKTGQGSIFHVTLPHAQPLPSSSS